MSDLLARAQQAVASVPHDTTCCHGRYASRCTCDRDARIAMALTDGLQCSILAHGPEASLQAAEDAFFYGFTRAAGAP